MNIKMLTFFFNLTLNSTLSFPRASLSVFCDLRCRRLGVAGAGIPSIALLEGDDEAGRDGEDLASFLRGGITNRSECGVETSPVSELLLSNSSFR